MTIVNQLHANVYQNGCIIYQIFPSDINKATSYKAKAKARELKAKDFQHSPRPGQGHNRHTATVLDQNKSSDVICLLQSIAVSSDKNKITVITSASIFTARAMLSAFLGVVILSVCLSVCLSVWHTRALWLIQRTYRRHFYTTWKSNHTSFLTPKISAKFQRGQPQRGRQREVG